MTSGDGIVAGQAWSYRGARNPASRLVIGRVDLLRQSEVVSVCILDAVAHSAVVFQPKDIGHAPMTVEALNKSLLQQGERRSLPTFFEDGYRTWRAAFDEGRAGVFDKDIAFVVESVLSIASPQDID